MPETNFYMLIHGAPGQGKSTFCFLLAKYLTRFGKVLFVSAEEGISYSLQLKMRDTELNSNKVIFTASKKLEEIETTIKANDFKFLVIDSINMLNVNAETFDVFREKYNIAIIGILQSTKTGSFRGSQEWTHNSDIVIKVENFLATTEKGRYGVGSYQIITKNTKKDERTDN